MRGTAERSCAKEFALGVKAVEIAGVPEGGYGGCGGSQGFGFSRGFIGSRKIPGDDGVDAGHVADCHPDLALDLPALIAALGKIRDLSLVRIRGFARR